MADKSTSEKDSRSDMNLPDIDNEFGGVDTTHNMDFLLDIPLEITVELGSSKITIGDLLKLSQGSVVELNKLTDEPLDIYVNKKLMAHGEVVVVNEKFGIRLTNIVSPGERVKGLS
ncbi:MAG: flagellar motor switch protein FliN [Deltaproteobacteria bacterium]|nr:flagellar motor switch protein FliN [Deltaproteobacteria bacterium]